MATYFQSFEISDLSLGKPPLRWIASSTTVGEALETLKELNLTEISVWDCPVTDVENAASDAPKETIAISRGKFHGNDYIEKECHECQCVGRVNMVDILCYLVTDKCLQNLHASVLDPVSVLLPTTRKLIRHVDLHERLCNALYLMLEGAQYLVVPLVDLRHGKPQKTVKPNGAIINLGLRKHTHGTYCWLTQEDVLRFMLSHIGVFSPLPMQSIEKLCIINADFMSVQAHNKAINTLPLLHRTSQSVSAVAIVEGDPTSVEQIEEGGVSVGPKLVGDISLSTLKNCNKTAAFALASLSVSEFISYSQTGELPPKAMKNFMNLELRRRSKSTHIKVESPSQTISDSYCDSPDCCTSTDTSDIDLREDLFTSDCTSSSSDESYEDPFFSAHRSRNWSLSRNNVLPITCRPWSSLIAVMAQALAHRTCYVWVTDDDKRLIGIVTYCDIISVFLKHMN